MVGGRISEKDLRREIFFLRDYHSYWKIFRVLHNPKADAVTRQLMNLKDPAHSKHGKAIVFFGDLLNEFLADAISEEQEVYAAIVPSHEKGKTSSGLAKIIDKAAQNFNIVNDSNPLERHISVEKLSHGGDRSRKVHLKSIRVKADSYPKGATVLLIDDVTTSENSLKACKKLLYEAGAGLVITVAMTKTVDDDE